MAKEEARLWSQEAGFGGSPMQGGEAFTSKSDKTVTEAIVVGFPGVAAVSPAFSVQVQMGTVFERKKSLP